MTDFFDTLRLTISATVITDIKGEELDFDEAFATVIRWATTDRNLHGKVIFIGNGGSAAIASHMANDWLKNGGYRAMCFNDGAALTCLGNDTGFDNVFSIPVDRFATHADMLVAISSSGKSENILRGVAAAHKRSSRVVTFSGFDDDNPLRKCGHINFHVPSNSYGIVEVSHLAIIHAMLDQAMRP